MSCKLGVPLQEIGQMTRAEVGLLYNELKHQELRETAQQALYLLPAIQAGGLIAVGNKKAVGKANSTFKKLEKELGKIAYGER